MPSPGRFAPRKDTLYTLCRRLDEPQDQYGRVQKISLSLGFDVQTVQPLARRHTDYPIPAHPSCEQLG